MTNNQFLDLIKTALHVVQNYSNRHLDKHGKPGGLIETLNYEKTLIIGDLHGAVNNFKAIMEHMSNTNDLMNNNTVLIITGDALHNDQTSQMREMFTSFETLKYLLQVIAQYPDRVIYIRGNHDTFDNRLSKSSIQQGQLFKEHILKLYSIECVKELEIFFESLPVFIIGDGYVITHAGPPRDGLNREEIINIRSHSHKYMQLLWTRINEFRGNPNAKEYDERDIRLTLEKLKLPLDTHFIVGHNPLWNTGNRTGVWMNVLGIKNHHIIYSNLQTHAPYFSIQNKKIKTLFAIKQPPEVIYV